MIEAYEVAGWLRTRHESKKHGGYDIYEDDKIEIWYDTYFPNLSIYVKKGSEKVCVLSKSGHGHVSEYHPGKWEDYIRELHPRALEAKRKIDEERVQKEQLDHNKKFAPINDGDVFSS